MKVSDGIVTVPNFFSEEECRHFINLSEGAGYEEATVSLPGQAKMMKNVRNNDRVIFDDPCLADTLFPRIKNHILEVYEGHQPHSLNSRFRFYRYTPGQRFKRHIDGSQKIGDLASKVTFMIYLNDDCQGGETIFREKDAKPGGDEEFVIAPVAGMALLFQHRLWHEGASVTKGAKYVLRTDVFYRDEE